MSEDVKPAVRFRHFEGPLDLLFHLIEKNDIDIYDIPIASITEQYMDYLASMQRLDMEIASDFLVMGATLVHIKSKMMLPGAKGANSDEEGEDPREELVISLMRYKRCRVFANELRERRDKYDGMRTRPASTAKDLGITIDLPPQGFVPECFDQAIEDIKARNEVRYADISTKITNILQRDKLSIKERIKSLADAIRRKGKLLFSELFKDKKATKMDRIVSFLAVLEMVRNNRAEATQKKNFGDILLEEKKD
ncbi:MAG: segregation/condensation protein A [Saccharofermentans sp.]|nr:segregation/condensation protein A [Saccharofermentans sp.]